MGHFERKRGKTRGIFKKSKELSINIVSNCYGFSTSVNAWLALVFGPM